jgi:hypothetical protein
VISTLRNLPPRRHWLEVLDFTEVKVAICTVLALSRPIGTDALEAISYGGADIHGVRKTGLVKKINEPCKMFTTTGIPFLLEVLMLLLFVWRSR